MKKYIAILATCLLAFSASAQKERTMLDKVVATLGDKIIMSSDLEEGLRAVASQNNNELPPDANCLILDQLLIQKLLLLEAEKDSLPLKDEEVEAQLDSRLQDILRYMNGDVQQFKEYYSITPLEMKEKMRDDMKNQMLSERMRDKVIGSASVTPAEVMAFYNRIPKDSLPFFNSEVEISELVIQPKLTSFEEEAAKMQAQEIRDNIVSGVQDFGDAAELFSADPGSAAKKGDLGIQTRGTFVPEFESAAYRLKPGEISPVIKSQFGYHIIKLQERLGNSIHCSHILIQAVMSPEDQQRALAKLDTIRTLILADTMTFVKAVKKYSDNEQSKNLSGAIMNNKTGETFFETGDLDVDIFFTIDTMNVGDISAPIEYVNERGATEYRIIRLNSRTEPHQANLKDDYARIQTAALEEKKSREIAKWVKQKINTNFVEFAPEFQKCVNLQKWTTQ